MSASIEIAGLSKVFRQNNVTVEAIARTDLSVEPASFVSIIGPSGCGKSTLLRIVAGLTEPTSGSVAINGHRVVRPTPSAGFVFQAPVLLPWRTVLGNVELYATLNGLDPAAFRERARNLIAMVGLSGFEEAYPYQLSGGMQQRVGLCRALLHDPALLLMDEPFAALDLLTRETMMAELQRIWLETRKTVLFVTHSIAEAVFLSDRVAVMSARPGRILDLLDVHLPRPRTLEVLESPAFIASSAAARAALTRAAGS
jgi:NitT/TauT family transport system ATP-binding protein